jgi:hypothetical protein
MTTREGTVPVKLLALMILDRGQLTSKDTFLLADQSRHVEIGDGSSETIRVEKSFGNAKLNLKFAIR